MLAKLLFIVQLLVSWAIVVISTLYASRDSSRTAEDCADGVDCESGENAWWIVSDSSAITALGETVFFLTVAASFLISFDSYVNAKARASLCIFSLNPDGCRVNPCANTCLGAPRPVELPLTRRLSGGRGAGGS